MAKLAEGDTSIVLKSERRNRDYVQAVRSLGSSQLSIPGRCDGSNRKLEEEMAGHKLEALRQPTGEAQIAARTAELAKSVEELGY
jgi:hypothetical protein